MGVLNQIREIGAFDRRIKLKFKTYTQNSMGEPLETVSSTQTVWAHIKWTKGGEKTEAGMETNNPDYIICIRYNSIVDTDTTIEYDGEDYDITYVKETGRRRFLDLHATKREV